MASKRKSAKKNLKARRRRARKAFFLCLFLFALLALITRLLVFVPVKMETNAMQPVYQQNDVVFASRLAMLRGDAIARGEDVYAYFAAANGSYVRRVVGMPGDLIDVRDGQRYLVYDGGAKEIALGEAPGLVYGELPEGAYLLQDYRSGDQASWTYPTQEGMAFAGWYKDASFTTPCAASDVEGAAYAKFVPITDLLQFKGGSLRMDVTDPSTSTYLRFGYTMAIPEKSAFIENGWYYKKVTVSSPDDVRFVAYNNAMNNDGTVTANLVFNNVKTNLYKANFTEKAFVKYVTADGTTVEAVESDYQTRSVGEVADAILKHPMASNSEKEYALKIKSAIQ